MVTKLKSAGWKAYDSEVHFAISSSASWADVGARRVLAGNNRMMMVSSLTRASGIEPFSPYPPLVSISFFPPLSLSSDDLSGAAFFHNFFKCIVYLVYFHPFHRPSSTPSLWWFVALGSSSDSALIPPSFLSQSSPHGKLQPFCITAYSHFPSPFRFAALPLKPVTHLLHSLTLPSDTPCLKTTQPPRLHLITNDSFFSA